MMKKIIYISFLLCLGNTLVGQVGLNIEGKQLIEKEQLNWEKRNEKLNQVLKKGNEVSIPLDLKKYFLADKISTSTSSIFSQKNTSQELAFFCRIEEKIELKSNIPVRFRLGEVQAVDKKEGKWQQFNN